MLDTLDRNILELLTFEEEIAHLYEEISELKPVIADALKTLISRDLVLVFTRNEENGGLTKMPYFDSDNLDLYLFRMSKKGMDAFYESS